MSEHQKLSQNDQFESRLGAHKRAGSEATNLTHLGVAQWALNRRVVDPDPSLKGLPSAESVLSTTEGELVAQGVLDMH